MWPWFAASDSHVWAHWEGLLLASNLPVAVEQDGPAALVLMQKAAVLEVGDKRHLALHTMIDSSSSILAGIDIVILPNSLFRQFLMCYMALC